MAAKANPTVVYLDQMKWIDLARADHARADGAPFLATLSALEQCPEDYAVFPLGMVHVIETLNTSNPGRRRRLAETMGRLSRFHTLNNPFRLRDQEFLQAFGKRFGRAIRSAPEVPTLGRGLKDVYSEGVDDNGAGDWLFAHWPAAWYQIQLDLLAGAFPLPAAARDGWREQAARHTQNTLALDASLSRAAEVTGAAPRDLRLIRRKIMRLAENIKILEHAETLLKEAWDPKSPWVAPPDNWLDDLLEDLPTLYVGHQLLLAIYDNPQIPRELSTFADIAWLCEAIVYCDVVVTEKQWCRLVSGAKLDGRFGTTMLADLNALPAVLGLS